MRFLGREFLSYGCVVAGGLLVGLSLPRPSWATLQAAAPAPAPATAERSSGGFDEVDALGLPSLEPMPAAMDGAESPELRALRLAEKRMFADAAPTKPVSMPPEPDVCQDGALCREEANGGTDWMQGLRLPDLPVRADVKVQRFMHYFAEDAQGRKIFRSWLKRSGRYRSIVETALRERALPRDLVALVFIESGFSPHAVSSAGAVGLWQFMPETGRAYGLAVEADYDERRSIARASDAATRHLSDLYEKFGSWELALAAYDLGYKGMLDRVRDTGSNDFWTISKINGALPREAVLYVPKVIAVAILLNNLERYGFDDTHVDPPVSIANLEVPAGLDLATIARATGTSVQHLHDLNPEILGDAIPDRGRSFIAHVPAGGVARANAMLPRLIDRRDRDGLEQQVGRNFDWGRDEVPRADRSREADDLLDPPRVARAPAPRPFPSIDGDGGGDSSRSVFYRVGDHESVQDVARMFGVSAQDVIDENYLDPSAKLQKGMLLSLTVRGDVMSRIAKKRAAARLERQDAEADDDKKDDGEVMHGYALTTPRSPDKAPLSTLAVAPTQKANSPVSSDAPKPSRPSVHAGSKGRLGADAVRRDGK